MDQSQRSEAIFGVFDGLVSVSGVIIGLLSAANGTLLSGAIGLAAASTVSMAAGEYLGDPERNVGRSAVMAVGTAVGTVSPIIPFVFLDRVPAVVVAVAVGLIFCSIIAWYRGTVDNQKTRSFVETYGVFVVSIAVTAVVTLLTGATG